MNQSPANVGRRESKVAQKRTTTTSLADHLLDHLFARSLTHSIDGRQRGKREARKSCTQLAHARGQPTPTFGSLAAFCAFFKGGPNHHLPAILFSSSLALFGSKFSPNKLARSLARSECVQLIYKIPLWKPKWTSKGGTTTCCVALDWRVRSLTCSAGAR